MTTLASREPLTVVESALVPLPISDVDTDQIVPGRFITSRTREEFARALFAGRRAADPGFVLNRAGMAGRSILVAGRNFGCGSSREQAVWALQAGGFRVIIAPSFSDIFAMNARQNGLLTVVLDADRCHALVSAAGDDAIRVDLVSQTVSLDTGMAVERFDTDDFYRQLLLEGRSELDYLLAADDEVTQYEGAHSQAALLGSAELNTVEPHRAAPDPSHPGTA